jgi:hypothetical protein
MASNETFGVGSSCIAHHLRWCSWLKGRATCLSFVSGSAERTFDPNLLAETARNHSTFTIDG